MIKHYYVLYVFKGKVYYELADEDLYEMWKNEEFQEKWGFQIIASNSISEENLFKEMQM